MDKIKFIFLILSIIVFSLQAQVIYQAEASHNNYFLFRLDQKGLITINQSLAPIRKTTISSFLVELNNKRSKLNHLELEELDWNLRKYSLENGSKASILGELNLIEENSKIRLYPIIGYKYSTVGGNNGYSKKIGIHLDAYFGKNLEIMFEYLDTGQFGDNVDRLKIFTSERGYFYNYNSIDGIEFSDVRGQLNYIWDWGVISLKKDYNKWGHGKYGQLILSDKAASYPHIQLQLNPTSWLSINYHHGWLNSYVIDSSKSFYYGSSEVESRLFEEYKSKYIAANYISLIPTDWLTFSIGNSFIYSGDIRPEMFIPLMYYKAMDHNTGRGSVGDGNGIIYLDLGIKYPNNILIYGTIIADVINVRDMLDGQWHKQWFGYTVGGSVIDLVIQNLDFRIEYTKTNPWVYENKYELTNHKHLNYSLGHWIGQNADLLTTEFNYSFIRGMYISIMWQLFRKGDMIDNYFAYEDPINLEFLYGDRRIENRIKFSIEYEFIHNIYLQGYYSYSDITDENEGRTQNFMLGNKHSLSLALSYGLPF